MVHKVLYCISIKFYVILFFLNASYKIKLETYLLWGLFYHASNIHLVPWKNISTLIEVNHITNITILKDLKGY
jgi:hypothetical protein